MKAYKIRCYPNEEQKELILKTFGCCRWYWNQALSDNINYYKNLGIRSYRLELLDESYEEVIKLIDEIRK